MNSLLVLPDFTFSHQKLPNIDLSAFSQSFNNLSPDPHIEGDFRLRGYSRFSGHPPNLKHLRHQEFVQSKDINSLYGGICRDFAELDDSLIALPQFEQMIQSVIEFFGLPPDKTILGVHQIRIVCSTEKQGLPVPEGVHQDGFDLIALCCISRQDVSGAETRLYEDPKCDPLYTCTLQPGDIIYCNDRNLYHYTSPIQPVFDDKEGSRDMFVVTVSLDGQ